MGNVPGGYHLFQHGVLRIAVVHAFDGFRVGVGQVGGDAFGQALGQDKLNAVVTGLALGSVQLGDAEELRVRTQQLLALDGGAVERGARQAARQRIGYVLGQGCGAQGERFRRDLIEALGDREASDAAADVADCHEYTARKLALYFEGELVGPGYDAAGVGEVESLPEERAEALRVADWTEDADREWIGERILRNACYHGGDQAGALAEAGCAAGIVVGLGVHQAVAAADYRLLIPLIGEAAAGREVIQVLDEDATVIAANTGEQQSAFQADSGGLQRAGGGCVEAAGQRVEAVGEGAEIVPAQAEIQLQFGCNAVVVLHIRGEEALLAGRLAVDVDEAGFGGA